MTWLAPNRWFRRAGQRSALVAVAPLAEPTWASLAQQEASSAFTLRTAWLTGDELDHWVSVAEAALGPLSEATRLRLLGHEVAGFAVAAPGDLPDPAPGPVLDDVLSHPQPEALLAELGGPVPAVPASPPPTSWAAFRWGPGGALVQVRTIGPNWLPRGPLPPAFYGTERPLDAPGFAEVASGALPLSDALADVVSEPAAWRTDWWLAVLSRIQPFAAVVSASERPDRLRESLRGTPVEAPLLQTWGEWLLPTTPDPRAAAAASDPRGEALAACLGALGVRDDVDAELARARDVAEGRLPLDADVVRRLLVEPLRSALVAERYADARLGIDRARRLGGPACLPALRDLLIRDGSVGIGEWNESLAAENR